MAELDFSGQCSIGREDELGCLAQNLNSLSASLSTALNDLQIANQQLKTDIENKNPENKNPEKKNTEKKKSTYYVKKGIKSVMPHGIVTLISSRRKEE